MYETFDNEFTWRAHLHYNCKADLPADLSPESLKKGLIKTKALEFAAVGAVIPGETEDYWDAVVNKADWVEVSRRLNLSRLGNEG